MIDPAEDSMVEPWCWPPEVVARLTDQQIQRIRMKQAEKVRAMSANAKSGENHEEPVEEVTDDAKREQAIAILMDFTPGKTREQAAREYDASERL